MQNGMRKVGAGMLAIALAIQLITPAVALEANSEVTVVVGGGGQP